MSLTYKAGRSWVEIERAGTRELLAGEAPRCRYHVGIRMKRIILHRAANTTTGMVRHEGTVTAFRCPVEGCFDVSGRTIQEEECND